MSSLSLTAQTPAPTLTSRPATQEYHILIIEDLKGKRSIPLSYATYSLGRDSTNTIQLQDPAVSRQHFLLLRVPSATRKYIYRVVDGDVNGKVSLNGITVNGNACKQKNLVPGDIIHLGEVVRIKYHIQPMTQEEYNWYFNRKDTQYRSIQEEALDPVGTMTTILAQ